MQQSKSYVAPKGSLLARPPLPVEHTNPFIKLIDPQRPPPVKFQEIVRDGHATVARIKIQTPGSHAFILRRLDTGAISLTTMFRAAFPTAPDDAEKAEALWVKTTYEVTGANKSGKARFAGTWVTPEVAQSLAEGYSLAALIKPLVLATPDPDAIHRKPKQQQPTPVSSPAQLVSATTPKEPGPAPPKRRREASPARSPQTTPAPAKPPLVAKGTPSPSRAEKVVTEPTPSRLPVSTKRAASPARQVPPPATPQSLRRSTRLKSPAPPSGAVSAQATLVGTISPKTPKIPIKPVHEELTPGGSDETAVDEDALHAARATEVDMQEDIREQRELIERLKAERAAKAQAQAVATQEAQEMSDEEATLIEPSAGAGPSKAQKRAREEEGQLKFNIKEPAELEAEVEEERAVVTNSRIRKGMAPERKQLAWGALFFAAGWGAISFLPNLPHFF
ncbi:unnamed protein product [Somion occarium]|uniref:HTH APSES-type domain-containing protein n=1 Tax=Somion occarium TaxID=3059160 RepID=A0ABP1ECV3_9APHY